MWSFDKHSLGQGVDGPHKNGPKNLLFSDKMK